MRLLIPDKPYHGNKVHLTLCFQFSKDVFLRTLSVVVPKYVSRRALFVGDDDFELVSILVRNKQVQLNRSFSLFLDFLSEEDEAIVLLPTSRRPVGFEI